MKRGKLEKYKKEIHGEIIEQKPIIQTEDGYICALCDKRTEHLSELECSKVGCPRGEHVIYLEEM